MSELVVAGCFVLLMVRTAAAPETRARLAAKPAADWVLDLAGLLVQGTLVPLGQAWLAGHLLAGAFPGLAGSVAVPAPVGFLLAFVGVDYLYYWNHRLLHAPAFWAVHRVHHTMRDRDVLGTSRNTLWSSLFILYLWVHAAAFFLLADPRGYLAGVAATSCLDLWRHGAASPAPGGALHRVLSPWLILPDDHAWHHAAGRERGNYGANLKLWDRLHGTLHEAAGPPDELGIPDGLSLAGRLFWPFGGAEGRAAS